MSVQFAVLMVRRCRHLARHGRNKIPETRAEWMCLLVGQVLKLAMFIRSTIRRTGQPASQTDVLNTALAAIISINFVSSCNFVWREKLIKHTHLPVCVYLLFNVILIFMFIPATENWYRLVVVIFFILTKE